jgi:UDP-N-acetylglucosamine 2-epimerase (non-hydrolysing)
VGRVPRILILFGTRPEAIKLAPVARALEAREEEVDVRVVSTGQHDALLRGALVSLEMTIEDDLEIMRPDQDLYDIGIECLGRLRMLLQTLKPDVVVVEGDTASVFYGALAGFFERIQVAHVEAGLRSRDKWAPFPEEVFRRLTDVMSDYYFAPTPGARQNLLAEGVPDERVHVTGNTVIDAVRALNATERPVEDLELEKVLATDRRIVLVTVHRRESFGEPIKEILRALRELAQAHPDHEFIYPVHPNPKVQGPAKGILSDVPNFRLLEPLSYSDLVHVLSRSWLVFTDSGGIQEEAPTFGVPVLVLRGVTERPEGVEAGVAELLGTSGTKIIARGGELLSDPRARAVMAQARNPYGDGHAGERIADLLLHELSGVPRQTEDWI